MEVNSRGVNTVFVPYVAIDSLVCFLFASGQSCQFIDTESCGCLSIEYIHDGSE